jgi:hypothetical protein
VGSESKSKEVASDVDSTIEKNYKAALTVKGLDKEHIRFDAKNGVLTLKGKVRGTMSRNCSEMFRQTAPVLALFANFALQGFTLGDCLVVTGLMTNTDFVIVA